MTTSPGRRRVLAILLGILAAGYFALLLLNRCDFAAGPDSSGYLNEARLLLSGRTSVPLPVEDAELAHVFTPYGFMRGTTAGTMVPTYPVGTALHLGVAAALGGWRVGPFLVGPLAALGCLFLTSFIARKLGVNMAWSIVAAILLAAFPMFIAQAVQPVSDVLATLWALIAIACALRVNEHWRWAAASGIAFAIGVAVRPTNVLLILPLLLVLRSRIWLTVVAASPFAVALALYYDALYGSPFHTGYGGVGLILSFAAVPPCLSKQSLWLLSMATPLLFPLALIRGRALLWSWFGVFFLFYAYYSFCPDPSSTRFLLPALPALTIGLAALLARLPRALAVAIVLIVLGREVQQIGRLHVLHLNEWEAVYPRTVARVEALAPREAVVLSAITSGAFAFHSTRTVVRWDQLTPETAARLRAMPQFDAPWFAAVSEVEGGVTALRARIPGDWREVEKVRDVTVWRLD